MKNFTDCEPIMDSVYGIINVSQFEKAVISTKEMQRLRGIKQLGFVNLVYPDAEHSRFSHSLGVMQQAKMMINNINNNLANKSRYKDWITTNKQSVTGEDKTIANIEKIVISAAALLHDLPHSPFSHEIETPENKDNGIPEHDDFEKNPAFFIYLFDKSKSDLAEIIDIYNKEFWELVKKDEAWKKCFTNKDEIKDGYVNISENGTTLKALSIKYNKIPLLGVMIFEVLLFDRCNKWIIVSDDGEVTVNDKGIEIVIDYDKNKITWHPIKDWFRPYRKDIVADTICADLLDYLMRDAKNTGFLQSLDLKFFDRMTIAKAIPDKTNTLIKLKDIPDFCEHVVFDIYDWKRGIIRQSVITEIIAFLQQRYLLAERIYNHRVVEGARSMLQEASYLLVTNNAIKSEELHDTGNKKGAPINDDSLFYWILNKDADKLGKDAEAKLKIEKAQTLVKMIQERRIYRELVIIDGILGHHKGTKRGPEADCKTLADALLKRENRENIINKLNETLTEFMKTENLSNPYPKPDEGQLFTIGVRKFGKRYKIPKVVVASPITDNNNIETYPLFEGKKLPGLDDRLKSMKDSYNSLWKVYLFIHPAFHSNRFIQLHKNLENVFLYEIRLLTDIQWENSIKNYDELLPKNSIDIPTFIENEKETTLVRNNNKVEIENIVNQINNNVKSKNISLKVHNVFKLINKDNNDIKLSNLSDEPKAQIIKLITQEINEDLLLAAREGVQTEFEKKLADLIIKIIKEISDNEKGLF